MKNTLHPPLDPTPTMQKGQGHHAGQMDYAGVSAKYKPVPQALAQGTKLQPARAGHVSAMLRLENEAFTTPWGRKLIQGAVISPNYACMVLNRETHADIVGFCIYHPEQHRNNLDSLVVGAGFRSQGLGQWLMAHWFAACQQSQVPRAYLSLQVNTHNVKAMRFYQRYGFKIHHMIAGYYKNGDDAYQMQRKHPAPLTGLL